MLRQEGALLRPGALALARPKAAFRPPWAAFTPGLPRLPPFDDGIDLLPCRLLIAAAPSREHVFHAHALAIRQALALRKFFP